MNRDVTSPPFPALREVVATLESAGIECALGGSGLLASLGLETVVRDWDLTTDQPLEVVRAALTRYAPEHMGPNGVHADDKLMILEHSIECIVRFAFHSEGRVVRIPTLVRARWSGVPIGSAEAWAVAYALMGREEKSRRLFDHLEHVGADGEAVRRLFAEPLPDALRKLLSALPIAPSRTT
jgi:hypothetical protein